MWFNLPVFFPEKGKPFSSFSEWHHPHSRSALGGFGMMSEGFKNSQELFLFLQLRQGAELPPRGGKSHNPRIIEVGKAL